ESVVTGDFKVTAIFAPKEYTLRYSAAENGSLDGEALQRVEHGSDGVAVIAVPAPGYHFTTWSDGVTTVRRTEQQLSADLTVQAVFEVNTYIVGGAVTGLVEGTILVMQNNAGDDLTVSANGDFSFATELLNASNYEVSVLDQPTSPNQTCTVKQGSGTISAAHVSDVAVICILNTYSIGGKVAGLPAGDRVVLRNNGGDELSVSANGPFVFSTHLDDGSSYEVKIHDLPEKPNWTCELFNPAGALSGQNVTDVSIDCYPMVVLQATAGIRKVTLSWNRQDFDKVTFQLCQAKTEIPGKMFDSCLELEGGTTSQPDESPQVIAELTNDIPYWFQLGALYPGGRKTLSEVVKAMPFGGLNDTGIDWCANGFSNLDADRNRADKAASCKSVATSFPGQDAFQGRDSASLERRLKKTGRGAAGFDFTKLCRNGDPAGEGRCPPNPSPGTGVKSWGCTRDNMTGLTWEIKSETGLQGKDSTYSWNNPTGTVNGGQSGLVNGGICEGSLCDTLAYINKINEAGLCGISDWRLPTREELLSIVNNGSFKPAADLRFFPNTAPDYYWSSSPYSEMGGSAWQVYFLSGEAYPDEKNQSKKVRLVRGKTGTFGLDNP
ncbi:MAG: DUF1566 domain-containing protein, partial [Desulfuromusa sp.]|nr:DUF1566 domain-containing protein [Desulfuromusa sp.]